MYLSRCALAQKPSLPPNLPTTPRIADVLKAYQCQPKNIDRKAVRASSQPMTSPFHTRTDPRPLAQSRHESSSSCVEEPSNCTAQAPRANPTCRPKMTSTSTSSCQILRTKLHTPRRLSKPASKCPFASQHGVDIACLRKEAPAVNLHV